MENRLVYKVFHKPSGKYCSKGLYRVTPGKEKCWDKVRHARLAISYHSRSEDEKNDYRIDEFEISPTGRAFSGAKEN